jgi:hypothetical protein
MRIPASCFVRFGVFSLAILLSLVGFTAAAFAQGGVGTITGAVTDPKGLSVPQARVVIKNTETSLERPLETTDSGAYTATFLQPGQYELTVSKDGFSTFVRKDLVLQVGQTLTIDVEMTVGTSVSEITVTGEAPLIEPDRSEMSQTVSESFAGGLPLNGRRWEQFVLLTPGVTTDGGSGMVSYHGISGLFNGSSVDGVSNQQAFFSEDRGRTAVGYTYSLDAVKEFNVNSSAYSAEFGNAAGGQVNSVTKSGANDMHGDLFYYLRYPSLNALDPYSKTHGGLPSSIPNAPPCPAGEVLSTAVNQCITQGEHQRQQFGGSVGGPIKKDKLFYFLNYDGQRRSFPIVYTGPSTTNSASAVSSMITNNCTASVGGVADTITGLGTTQCTNAVNFISGNIGPQPRVANQDVFLAKLDYQLSANNRLSASFNYMNFRSPNGYDTSPTFSAGSILQNGKFGTHDRFLVASWNSVISSTIVNDFRFQWSRDFQFYSANFGGPSVSLSSLFGYGQRNALPRAAFPDEHRLQFADSLSWVRNKHSFKFGVDISPVHELLINLFNGGGVYSYNYSDTPAATAPAATLQAWIADVYGLPLLSDSSTVLTSGGVTNNARCYGAGVVDNCIGRHFGTFTQAKDVLNSAQQAGKDDFYDVHYGTYAQDSWKVMSNLTLNLGVRWDMQWIPQPAHPYTTNPLGLFYTNTIYINKLDFAPRVGFAWQGIKNMVIRGGYGIFYGNTTNSLFYNTRVENGVVQKTFNCNANYTPSTGVFGTPSVCLATPVVPEASVPAFPNLLFNATGAALAAPFSGAVTPTSLNVDPSTLNVSSLAIRGQSPHFLEPMVHEAELGIEYELPGNMSASGTFLITKGQHLPVCPDANVAPSTTTVNYNVLPLASGVFAGNVLAPTLSSVQLPFYTSRISSGVGTISACQSIVHSLYEGLIVTVKKQFTHGFEFLANYTLAKAQDDGQVLGSTGTFSGSSDAPLDPYNQQAEWGTSDYDQRQRFITSLLYAPTFKVENSTLNEIVNGFGFSGVITIASPLPVNALMNSSSSQTFTGIGTMIDGGVTGGVSLNAGNNAGRIPVVPKNFFRGKTQIRDVDFRISRDIKLFRERYKLQIIGEAFNIFNHTMVTSVNTTAYNFTSNSASSTTCSLTILGNSNPCLTPNASFLSPTATSNGIISARQLQISGKFFF